VQLVRTERPGHASELVRALAGRHDAIFAAGGDGTAMEAAGAAAHGGPPVAIIPAGTGNQLARHFGIPRDPVRSVRALLGGVERRIDAARLGDGRRFALTAGYGFDVDMIHGASSALKRRFGVGAYMISGVRAFAKHHRFAVIATVDGVRHEQECAMAMIANVPVLMDGLVATGPGVRMDDGLLDLCIFDATSPLGAVGVMWRAIRRDFRPRPGTFFARGREIHLEVVPAAVPQADGDLLAKGPLHATVEPGGALFLVP